MPLTTAHPAAILPLHHYLRDKFILSALVIGSMAPDLIYFLPLNIPRAQTHTFLSLFYWSLPAGLIVLTFYYLTIRRTLMLLAPEWFWKYLHKQLKPRPAFSVRTVCIAASSILLGALTHICWDAFTHHNSWLVEATPFLQSVLLDFNGRELRLYKVLQHGSSLAGTLFLAWYVYKNLPAVSGEDIPGRWLSKFWRVLLLGSLIAIPAFFGASVALIEYMEQSDFEGFRQAVGLFVKASFATFGFLLLGLSIVLRLIATRIER